MKYQAVKINFEPKERERERENVISRTDEREEEGETDDSRTIVAESCGDAANRTREDIYRAR